MPNNSEIITSPKVPQCSTGTQLGALGVAIRASGDLPSVATPEVAARISSSLTPFRALPPKDPQERALTISAIEYLKRPAPDTWVIGRVLSLLSHYYVSAEDERATKAKAKDWGDILRGYPAWAINNAAQWWMSMENPERKRKPLPGDIQERAYKEMMCVRAAETVLQARKASEMNAGSLEAQEPSRVSPEAARDIMREYGFSGAVNIGGKFNE